MLINILNDCIVDMNTVRELETVSADTKKQVEADYNFKILVGSLKKMIVEVQMAVNASDFKPSLSIVTALEGFVNSCNKIITVGAANDSTTSFINKESKMIYSNITQEWVEYYGNRTRKVLSLLETIKGITPDMRVQYAINKIKKASTWNTDIANLKYLKDGLCEAKKIIEDLSPGENIVEFLKLVGEGKATVQNLTQEIMEWIEKEQFAGKLSIQLVS